ncbi:peptidyl-prolyl cis-trans isomerase [Roseovarius pelagicus]|uniref:SurA N-terminal domain-containing protein n=1 Tax=Roseovarius pelagicus TaxID=2980108 RepID=A0ABY6DFC6_9RHOB|nr:peptidyl-prolyl cis-trans isomerase [Roseovarius pelagicus]UXX83913.1 SurA N-terminal domain-containing protein [Roseovarius pelagicus]
MKGNTVSKSAMWVLMALLILGLGGFGVTNLSGNVRSVGTVGDAEIDLNAYARALQAEIRALEADRGEPVSFAQAQADGVDARVLSRLVSEAALDHETSRLGLSIGDTNLRDQILDIPGFRGIDGKFDREAYTFALDQAGLSEAAFEADIRAETARTLVQGAILSGVSTPTAYTDAILTYVGEARDVTMATLARGDLTTGLPEPTDEDLRSYHQSHLPDFTKPETRAITYVWLTPEMIIDEVEVDDAALREAYEARLDEFIQPERRLVERLAFPDRAAAEAAKAEIDAGTRSFEDFVEDRGLELSDVDMGDVALGDLDGAGSDVFAANVGDIAGPLDSPIGPALFRVNAVLQATETTYEDAEAELRDALAGDRARRVIDAQIDTVDDLLAGGATLEDIADETDMELGQIDWHGGVVEGISAYTGFRQAAPTITTSDYPEVATLEDGSIFAMRLDGITEPEIQPLEDVRAAVRSAWLTQSATDALRSQIADQVTALQNGDSFEDTGLASESVIGLTRRGFQPGTPPEFIETVFKMAEGDVTLIDGNESLFIVRLDQITPPNDEDPELAQLRKGLADQAAGIIAQDFYQVLAADIRNRAGITLDQQALNAVHANFQ